MAGFLLLWADFASAQGPMTNGENHVATIGAAAEVDSWTFSANQGDAITVSVAEVGAGDSAFVPYIRLEGPSGTLLDSSWNYLAAQVNVTAPQTGTYTVRVSSNDSGQNDTGTYQLILAKTPGAFVVPDEGGAMSNGVNHAGALHRGDLDLWTFTALQGAAITVSIGETGADSDFTPWLRLRGPNGALLDSTWNYLAGQVNATAPTSGTYTVVVGTNDSGLDATGNYLITLALTPADFTVDSGDQGGPMTNGFNHPGSIQHRGDLDLWRFTATQGAAITVSIGEAGADDTQFTPWLRLRGPNGQLLDSTWNYLAGQVNVTAPSTGTYTVVVGTNDSGLDATGDYLITLALTPLDFVVPTGDQGGAMTNGANHAGALQHRGDLDLWSFHATQNASITVSIGEVATDDTDFTPWLRLRGPNGQLLDSTWNYLAGQVNITAPSTGVYTVVVGTNDSGLDATGSYLITLALTPTDFVVDPGDQGGPIGDSADRQGSIQHRGDLDLWTFTTVKSQAISVNIGELAADDTALTPWIRLRGPNGAPVAATWNYQAARIEMNAPQTGLYTILVGTNDSGLDATGGYRLWVTGIVVPPTGADLQITKAGTLQGDTLTYTLTVTNLGGAEAANVVVTDNLPAGVSFVSCAAPGGSCGGSGNARTVTYVALAPTETRTITIVTTKSSGTSITNTATVASSTSDPGSGNNTATHIWVDAVDTDGDSLPNDWEDRYGLDSSSPSGGNGSNGDPDGDGVTNTQEFADNTHPRGFFTRFLAEGAANAFFDVRLALLNVSTTNARILTRYLQSDGTPVVHYEVLAPGRRRTITEADLGGLTSPDFSTVIESDQPIVLDRTMAWGGGYGSHAESGVPGPSTTWYLAEGSTSGDFALFYLLQNSNNTETTATIRYLLPFGQQPIERQYRLGPRSRTTIPVDDQGPELASTDVSAVITAPVPIIVERAMYKSTPRQIFAAGHGSAGVTTPNTTWFLAEGATGPFFDCFILLANPNDRAVSVTVDYLLLDGTTYSKSYDVPANGRSTIWVDAEEIPAGSGQRPLENVAVSSTITSTLPIIVERTMWWPGPGLGQEFWTEAHNSPGATATGTKWALAEGEVGGSEGAETYILIANTSSHDGAARVTLYFEDGASEQRDFTLIRRSRLNVNVSTDFASAFTSIPNRRFGAVVESLGTPAAEIVVERAMYTSPGGATWTAGTNALGARVVQP